MNVLVLVAGILGGGIIGGILGLLLGLGALALPGLGPMIAAGSLATTLGTASMGMVVGALLGGLLALLLITLTSRRSLNR